MVSFHEMVVWYYGRSGTVGITASQDKSEGFGLRNMRARASQIGGKLEIQTAADRGTSVIVTVPISS